MWYYTETKGTGGCLGDLIAEVPELGKWGMGCLCDRTSAMSWQKDRDVYVIEVIAAGVNPKNLRVEADSSSVFLNTGSRSVEISLPEGSDYTGLSAELKYGILKIQVPARKPQNTKRISVSVS